MVKSASQQSFNLQEKVCYCLERNCTQPKNSIDATNCRNCNSSLLLQNRYRAIKLIGQGGFGRTFKGKDESQPSQPYCAIKQFWVEPNGCNREKAAELFDREAQRLKVLGEHSQIPALQNYFVEAGKYLIQEFIDGSNLAQLSTEEAWNEQQIRQLLSELLPLISFIHSKQVIHRDIKPENIIRRQDNSLALVDFGAAKMVTKATANKTGTTIGSAAYIAPEQLKGKAYSPAIFIAWALPAFIC